LAEDWPSNPFWDFSIRLYGKPGVAEACIALQEKHGLDVNVLMYCAWRGAAMTPADVAAAAKTVSAWHDAMVRPLRALRTELKEDAKGAPRPVAERVRAQIKSAELNAERVEQVMLVALAPDNVASGTHAEANMLLYLDFAGAKADGADKALIQIICSRTSS
jgi:uncharacterized protein (TIGR02444 family)